MSLAYIALAAALAIPLLLVSVPMGVDTLSHLARIHVRAHLADDPALARLFEPRDVWVPYLGFDWLLTPLARVMPTLAAGRLFIVLLLWATVGTVALLRWTFVGRIGFAPLLIGLVSYNALLAWGFLNYLLGVVVALLGFAAWHLLRDRPWLFRVLIFAAFSTLLYFVHLLALALYGSILMAYELFSRRRAWRTPLRDWLVLGLQFAPAAFLWLRLPVAAPLGETGLYWNAGAKSVVSTSPFVFAGAAGGFDVGLPVFAVCPFLLFYLTRRGVLHWNRALAAPALTLALFGLIVPTRAFGISLVDMRFPLAGAFLAVAALGVAPSLGRRFWPVVPVLAFALAVEVGAATASMRACDRQYTELREALQTVPRGAVLTSVLEEKAPRAGMSCSRLSIYDHMAELVTIDRSGYSPDFFGIVTSMAARNGLATDTPPIQADVLTAEMLPSPGYLLWFHLGNRDRPLPSGIRPLRAGSFFTLFSIN